MAEVPSWLRYANQNATRDLPLSPELVAALAFLPEMGLSMEVFSGGQPAVGADRVGSHRHDHGNAADVFFRNADRRLDWRNEDDIPVLQEIVRRGKAGGITGWGAGEGYMQPGSMHVGFGSPSVWGAGGRGRTAPAWLRAAYEGGDGNLPMPKQYALDTTGYEQDSAPPPAPSLGYGEQLALAGSNRQSAPPLPPPYNVADRPIGEVTDVEKPNLMAQLFKPQPPKQKPTLAAALGEGIQQLGGAGGGIPQAAPTARPGAARMDAEAPVSPIDSQQAEAQRQALAIAMQRLNSGRLFV